MLPRAHARGDLSWQRRLIHRAGAAVGSFRVELVVSAEVRSHVRSVPPPNRKNPAIVLNAPELRGSLPPHQHERKTRAPVQSDLIVHFEQPTASPFFPGIRPCRKEGRTQFAESHTILGPTGISALTVPAFLPSASCTRRRPA